MLKVDVQYCDQLKPIIAKASDSISTFKYAIHREFGIKSNVLLTFNGNKLMNGTLEKNGLSDGAVINVEELNDLMTVYIQCVGQDRLPLHLDGSELILEIKQIIERKFEIKVEDQHLMYKSHELNDGTVEEHEITHNSVLYLSSKK